MCRALVVEQGNLSVVGPHFYIKSLQPLNEQLGYHPCFSVQFMWTWKNFVALEAARLL
jgi:hypothetical protein